MVSHSVWSPETKVHRLEQFCQSVSFDCQESSRCESPKCLFHCDGPKLVSLFVELWSVRFSSPKYLWAVASDQR